MGSGKRLRTRRAFTLLEVIMAVAIIALVGLSIYRFLELNLQAIRLSTERSTDAIAMEALISALQHELKALPPAQARPGSLLGEPHKFQELPADELQWIAGPGNGLFTRHAAADHRITLRLRPDEKGKLPTLGLRRTVLEDDPKEQNWLGLMGNVRALELRYFDPRMNAWLEKWTDPQARPTLVRIRIWRMQDVDPYEAILSLPATVGAVITTAGNPADNRPRGDRPSGSPPRIPTQ